MKLDTLMLFNANNARQHLLITYFFVYLVGRYKLSQGYDRLDFLHFIIYFRNRQEHALTVNRHIYHFNCMIINRGRIRWNRPGLTSDGWLKYALLGLTMEKNNFELIHSTQIDTTSVNVLNLKYVPTNMALCWNTTGLVTTFHWNNLCLYSFYRSTLHCT